MPTLSVGMVEKLSRDNTKDQKLRVMERFKSGECKVLISTDVAGMGVDVCGLSLVVNVGIPKTPWKFLQQCGRAGREGQPSAAVTVKFPVKGRSAPEASIKNALCDDKCLRVTINNVFKLDSFKNYSRDVGAERFECLQIGCNSVDKCDCDSCSCCSTCSNMCSCIYAIKNQDLVLKEILKVGDVTYQEVYNLMKRREEQDSDSDSVDDFSEDEEEDRVDELELSLVDITPQFATVLSNW